MKTDLATAIVTTIIGALAAYFICNLIIDPMYSSSSVEFNTVNTSVSSDLTEPDPNFFNYRSLNPTVEVYVGECKERNKYGDCVDESDSVINSNTIEEGGDDEQTNTVKPVTNPDEDINE